MVFTLHFGCGWCFCCSALSLSCVGIFSLGSWLITFDGRFCGLIILNPFYHIVLDIIVINCVSCTMGMDIWCAVLVCNLMLCGILSHNPSLVYCPAFYLDLENGIFHLLVKAPPSKKSVCPNTRLMNLSIKRGWFFWWAWFPVKRTEKSNFFCWNILICLEESSSKNLFFVVR